MKTAGLALAGGLNLVALPACLSRVQATDTAAAGDDTASSGPGIGILEPAAGFLNASSALVKVDVASFALDGEALGGVPEEGVGHWHLYESNSEVGDEALWGMAAETWLLATRLVTGDNELCAELTNNDHSPLDPPARDCVTVEVPTEARRLSILSPRSESIWQAIEVSVEDPMELELRVENFELDLDQAGGTADPGQNAGHLHLYLGASSYVNATDAVYLGAFGGTGIDVRQVLLDLQLEGGGGALFDDAGHLVPGGYTLTAELVNHDHSPLVPPVVDFVRFDVGP